MIQTVTLSDRADWFKLDRHISEEGFLEKVRTGQGYVCREGENLIGVLRYNLFWDSIPFCTLLYIDERCRGQGYGTMLMRRWEQDMLARGCGLVMTSTQVDEQAQHFYRKLGYKDSGGLILDEPGYAQPMELIMTKALRSAQTR